MLFHKEHIDYIPAGKGGEHAKERFLYRAIEEWSTEKIEYKNFKENELGPLIDEFTDGTSSHTWDVFDVTEEIKSIVDNSIENLGWVITTRETGEKIFPVMCYLGGKHFNKVLRPKLVITYEDEIDDITLFSGNNGETFYRGSNYTIEWASNIIGTVDIVLMQENSNILTIASGQKASGTYKWQVPLSLKEADNYRLKVIINGSSDESDNEISIGSNKVFVEVQGGAGSGYYAPGEIVEVIADPTSPISCYFYKWAGDISWEGRKQYDSIATFTVADTDMIVTSEYVDSQAISIPGHINATRYFRKRFISTWDDEEMWGVNPNNAPELYIANHHFDKPEVYKYADYFVNVTESGDYRIDALIKYSGHYENKPEGNPKKLTMAEDTSYHLLYLPSEDDNTKHEIWLNLTSENTIYLEKGRYAFRFSAYYQAYLCYFDFNLESTELKQSNKKSSGYNITYYNGKIEYTLPTSAMGISKIDLFTVNGKIVISAEMANKYDKQVLNLPKQLAKGIYLINVNDGKTTFTQKIMVK